MFSQEWRKVKGTWFGIVCSILNEKNCHSHSYYRQLHLILKPGANSLQFRNSFYQTDVRVESFVPFHLKMEDLEFSHCCYIVSQRRIRMFNTKITLVLTHHLAPHTGSLLGHTGSTWGFASELLASDSLDTWNFGHHFHSDLSIHKCKYN